MPVQNLPWLPSSDQFLRAIVAGSQLAESRAQRDTQNRPRFGGGGGGFRPVQVDSPAPTSPTDPHYVLNGSMLSYVDPNDSRFRTPEVAPQPFDVLGSQFITNPVTQRAESFVPPTRVEKVGNDLVQITEDRKPASPFNPATVPNIGVTKLYEGGNTSDRLNVNTIDTTGMTPEQASIAPFLSGSPRITGSPYAVSNYLASARSPQFPVPVTSEALPLPPKADKSTLKKGQVYKTARGNAMWDGDSFEPVQ